MKILILGATGFIGKHIAEELSKRKYDLRCLVRKESNIESLKNLNVKMFFGDVFDEKSLLTAMKGVDSVFNLVGGGDVQATFKNGYEKLRRYNIDSLKIILEAAAKAKIKRFVHFSSISAMGIITEKELNENSEPFPKTPHEVCKFETEKISEQYKKKMIITIIRPGIVFGPYGTNSEVLQLAKLMKKHFFPIPGNGKNIMPWVYIDDVVSASILAFEKNKKSCEKFIIVSSPEPTFSELINSIKNALKTKVIIIHLPKFLFIAASVLIEKTGDFLDFEPIINSTRSKSMTSNRVYNINKIMSLGYVPISNFNEAIQKTISWYKENGYI